MNKVKITKSLIGLVMVIGVSLKMQSTIYEEWFMIVFDIVILMYAIDWLLTGISTKKINELETRTLLKAAELKKR